MPSVTANGVQLTYESHGPEDGPAVVMIMGLGAQLTMWPVQMVADLVAAGHRVIVFDNRDIGLSAKIETGRTPNLIRQLILKRFGITLKTPYTLGDMANDTIGLMDTLELDQAHLVGVSMGGMIAQFVSANYPGRVKSLTAVMTTTGNPKLPRPSRDVMRAMFRRGPPPASREEAIDQSVATFGVIGTPGEDQNTNGMRDRLTASYDRDYARTGLARQMAAIIATGDFRTVTERVRTPALVIHGSADPLVSVEAGRDVARHISGAKLEIIDGMGHDMPPRFLPRVTEAMLDHFAAHR